MKKHNTAIDIVIYWVDGSDPSWLEEKRSYESRNDIPGDSSNSDQRFRDWGLMRYWFRGIDKYMPFINKIFFITWGHIPYWLNTDHERLVIVNHKDFIPADYLPTFNSSTIEMNFHRIKDLSENFILFNDDFFLIAPAKEEMFFRNNLPCDMLLSEIIYNYDATSVFRHMIFNDLGIINKYFGMKKRPVKALPKWINPAYGIKNSLTNLNKLPFRRIVGFKDQHLPIPHKKSTFIKLWELEEENFDRACKNRFRSAFDFNTWLMRYWNFMTGEFFPTNINKIGYYESFYDDSSVDRICNKIKAQAKPVLVINDTLDGTDEEQFILCKKKLQDAFESILPDKCSFEK